MHCLLKGENKTALYLQWFVIYTCTFKPRFDCITRFPVCIGNLNYTKKTLLNFWGVVVVVITW